MRREEKRTRRRAAFPSPQSPNARARPPSTTHASRPLAAGRPVLGVRGGRGEAVVRALWRRRRSCAREVNYVTFCMRRARLAQQAGAL